MNRLAARLIVVMAMILTFALLPGAAQAATVRCGDVITQSVVLDSDLNCSGDGIVIGASNVTLDLNGHTIHGSGPTGSGPTGFPLAGVRAKGSSESQGLTGLTIKGGTVTAFTTGISLENAGAVIRDMTLSGDGTGLFGTKLTTLDVESSVLSANVGAGLDVVKGTDDGAIYRNNVAADNGGAGMDFSFAAGGFTLTGNVIRDNAGTGLLLYKVYGPGEVSHNRIVGNGFGSPAYATADGMNQGYCGDLSVTQNAISHNRDNGIRGNLDYCRLSDNVISGNGGDGISAGTGVLTANRNRITGNGQNGIFVNGDGSGFAPPSAYLADNTVLKNNLDGIHIGADTGGYDHTGRSVLERNRADRSGHDGIETEQPNTTLTANRAWFNVNLGIEAVSGVTDGGGNSAKHNGNPLQCVPTTLCSTTGKAK